MLKTLQDYADAIPNDPKPPRALDVQIGGSHYKDFKIQPIEFIMANDIGFAEGNVIKYICRWRAKGGAQDIEKAIHYARLLPENVERENDATRP